MPGPTVKEQQAATEQTQNLKANKNNSGDVVEVCLKEENKAASAVAAASAASVVSVKNAAGTVKELIAQTNNKKDAVKRQEGVAALGKLCSTPETFRAYEPYVVMQALTAVLTRAEDKQALVRNAATAAAQQIVRAMTPYAAELVLTKVLSEFLTEEAKWRVKQLVLDLITLMAELFPRQIATCMNSLIILVKPALHDLKQEVAAAALKAMNASFSVVDNRDIAPFLGEVVKAMADPTNVQECIHQLASTTFVQTVESSHLSVIAPLLVRGFREPVVAVKRQCSVIVANMSKLVDDPAEAAPLLPELLPALERAADEISDPEARGVAAKALAQINRIKSATEKAMKHKAGENEAISAFVKELVNHSAAVDDVCREYLDAVAVSCIDCKHFDQMYWAKFVTPLLAALDGAATAVATTEALREKCAAYATAEEEEEEVEDDGEELCNCKFTLAYGTKILLHNTVLKLNRGCRYGLLGGNDSGKTTLMRAIANGQVDGFPPATELRTVFVEADIQGEMSHLSCLDYIFADEAIKKCNVAREDITKVLLTVGFTPKMVEDGVSTLSGGWRMKLALARAMLQKADILLLDEPTNHLDVINVQWVENYLNSLKDVTSIIVSHDSGLLDKCCTHILHIENLKLNLYRGNLSLFVEKVPEAKSFFELGASKLKFRFPQPGYLEGVKSKGKALMKMEKCAYTYPGNDKPTIRDITVQVSLSSRVACVGVNGAGKSTMIKLLCGVNEPQTGTVWVHQHARIAYVAQHAFAHIEKHLNKTATQYIQWRYENGEDKEGLEKSSMKLTEEEEAKLKEPVVMEVMDASGKVKKEKRVIARLTGARKQAKKGFEYEVMWENNTMEYLPDIRLEELGWGKHLKNINAKIEARDGMYARPLTRENIEQHIEDVGLSREFSSHYRMSALSGGQKVKVVLAAAMWNQPHILILDEPTNYLDRDSLGALAGAIREYEGGVVMITHNNEFCSSLCPETWVLENGTLDCRGDPEWMKNAVKDKVEFAVVEEMVDASGNTVKIKAPKKKLSRKERMAREKRKKMLLELGEEVSDSDDE